jgi:hypothetical protein
MKSAHSFVTGVSLKAATKRGHMHLSVTFSRSRSSRLRKNKLAKTGYAITVCDHIVGKSCEARNFFAEDKAAIASITFREGTGQVLGRLV